MRASRIRVEVKRDPLGEGVDIIVKEDWGSFQCGVFWRVVQRMTLCVLFFWMGSDSMVWLGSGEMVCDGSTGGVLVDDFTNLRFFLSKAFLSSIDMSKELFSVKDGVGIVEVIFVLMGGSVGIGKEEIGCTEKGVGLITRWEVWFIRGIVD